MPRTGVLCWLPGSYLCMPALYLVNATVLELPESATHWLLRGGGCRSLVWCVLQHAQWPELFLLSGKSKVLVFFRFDLLACMLPTFCPPTIGAIPLEFCRKASVLEADDFLWACYTRKAMTPQSHGLYLFPTVFLCKRLHMYVFMYLCMYVYMHSCVSVCMYLYTVGTKIRADPKKMFKN